VSDRPERPGSASVELGQASNGSPAVSRLPSALTPRQRQIAQLIARGASNVEIGRELVLSSGTVANHVAAILTRLGLSTRAQIAAWATAQGLNATEDRLLVTLERLLEMQPTGLGNAMDQVASLVAEVLGTDKVDAFLHEPETATLVAVGASDTPMSRRQRALGLDRQPLANGGRAVMIFETGQPHLNGRVGEDGEELIGVRRSLGVRSQVGVPLEVAGARRGVLLAQSEQLDFFSERDVRFLQAVSRWLGTVIQRVELGERTATATLAAARRLAAEELITILAHDLQNDLVPIRTRVQLLGRRAAREQHQANLEDTARLLEGVEHLGRLISDLLDVARLDQGLFTLSRQPVDLACLVREVAGAMSAPGAVIAVEAPPELGVVADPVRIRQALENLLANAAEHSPEGATVAVRVAVESLAEQTWAVVCVQDDGPGISPELLPRLFERFTKTPGSAGLGLGLHLAQQIARAHGGTLDVASTPGQGATFRLALPLR
jgi:two-component system, OmpR family, sensor kinase